MREPGGKGGLLFEFLGISSKFRLHTSEPERRLFSTSTRARWMTSLGFGVQTSCGTLGNVAQVREGTKTYEDLSIEIIFLVTHEEMHELGTSEELDHSQEGDLGLAGDPGDPMLSSRLGHTRKKGFVCVLGVDVKDLSYRIWGVRIIWLVAHMFPHVLIDVLMLGTLRKTRLGHTISLSDQSLNVNQIYLEL